MPYGPEIPVTHASAGMKRVLALAYLLVWAWREHLEVSRIAGRASAERMLVIIDEVEAHLHPKWQRVILSAIVEALTELTTDNHVLKSQHKAPKIQYIVATHSPLVLASLEPLFDPALDALFELQLLQAEDGTATVELSEPEFRRHGGAEKWLVSESFGLKSSRSLPAENLLEEAAALVKGPTLPPRDVLDRMEARLAGVLTARRGPVLDALARPHRAGPG